MLFRSTFLRFTAAEENGYFYSNTYPYNVLSDARYFVIKYRTTYEKADEIGILWKTRQDPEFRLDYYYDYIVAADGWNYAVIDMSNEGTWQDYIRNIGFVPFLDDANAVGATFDIAWIEFYGEDPLDLYEDKMQTQAPETTEPKEEETTVADAEVTTDASADATEATTEAPAEKKGCGAIVAAPVVALVAMLGVAFVAKKKD